MAQVYRIAIKDSFLERKRELSLWLVLVGIFSVVMVASDARSTLVGVIFAVCVVGFGMLMSNIGNRTKRYKIILSSIILLAVSLFIIIEVLEIGRFAALQNPLQDNSLQARFGKWTVVFPLILERFFIGHGPSKAAQLSVGIYHIDSGFLSWWYHFGILGVISYLAVALGAIRMGVGMVGDRRLFQGEPVFWSAAVALLTWFIGSFVVWTFAGIPQDRRVFTLLLIWIALLMIYQVRTKATEMSYRV